MTYHRDVDNIISHLSPCLSLCVQVNLIQQYLAVQFSRQLKRPDYSPFTSILNALIFRRRNAHLEWAAVEMMQPSPGQTVLEIGYGLGYGVLFAAERVAPQTVDFLRTEGPWDRIARMLRPEKTDFANDGHVYGVDISRYMYDKACKRLKPLIREGIVTLNLASVDHLPMLASSVDCCFHVDCFYYWPELTRSLKNLWRVLRPDGKLVTTFSAAQLRMFNKRGWLRYGRADPVAYALALESCGFDRVEWIKDHVSGRSKEPFDCILARKPPTRLLHSANSQTQSS
ncbi:unnamed protein product [Calicophoron daubneyi]|uniref:Methyltransferase type 11 domain-containing protein n=1 Tax=Calicophoron daubneyi TaxID=300641 RepID=A0AAV2T4A4_CALDB